MTHNTPTSSASGLRPVLAGTIANRYIHTIDIALAMAAALTGYIKGLLSGKAFNLISLRMIADPQSSAHAGDVPVQAGNGLNRR
jgi:hypothetical protein